jgi:AhpD family alkylhydroperoxidase
VTERVAEALEQFGAGPSDLYRALANNDLVGELWVRFAWGLRNGSRTPRPLRELMILRTAQLQDARYVWRDHTAMARAAGVSEEQIASLASWQSSDQFDEPTRACLVLTEEMVAGHVSEETLDRLAQWFSAEDRVELIVTAGFYCMVPRVLDALRLFPEDAGE